MAGVKKTNQQDLMHQQIHSANTDGLISCHYCGSVWKDAHEGDTCEVCGAHLHIRKPNSLNRTWAYLLAACILYLPANMYPVMVTKTLLGQQSDTILSGIIYFWRTGSWELAILIFAASFMVPLFKLVTLFILVITAQRRSVWRCEERAKLYRIVEFIGRWSMLDVFVVTLLAGIVQIRGFVTITAGVGVAAFGAVVVLTMLASISFDPRLIWDGQNSQRMVDGTKE